MSRRLGNVAALAFLLGLAACAPRSAPVLPAPGAPKFPDFVFPAAPANLGPPAAVAAHELGWQWLQAGDLRAADRNFTAALEQAPGFYPSETGMGYLALARKDNK